jgi:hypothetical protein
LVWPARIALVLLVIAAPAGAQELTGQNVLSAEAKTAPDAPALKAVPDKPEPQHNFLIRPFYDKQVRLLAEVNAAGAVMDDVSSRLVIEQGGYEKNPLMRPFVHNSGTLAAESVVEVWAMAYLGNWMKHSHHAVLRKTWWLPQTVNFSAKISGGIYNTTLLAQ